ncbi:MAG: hypothetical protein RLZZ127_774 [Planctomycetota bacterium]|jgi:tetratricopeptide (TPR) repeat protein
MVDLSKHIARAKQGLDRNAFELVFETVAECIDVDPGNLEVHRILCDAAKRKAKLGEKSGLFGLTVAIPAFSKDPQKLFAGAVKRLFKGYDNKLLYECGLHAQAAAAAGSKAMTDVSILYYEEARGTGLFHEKCLWNLAHAYMERFKAGGQKDEATLDLALRTIHELDRAMPTHAEAGKVLKNWEALKSMLKRNKGGAATDYRSQLASDTGARKAEVMNRMIRTPDDAREVLQYIDEELKANPGDKAMWIKKGGILARYGSADDARAALREAQRLDPNDFIVSCQLADLDLADLRKTFERAKAAGQGVEEAEKSVLTAEISEFRRRIERQPTDMNHRYQLGLRLAKSGDVEGAAAEFQRSVNDARLKKSSLRYLGWCFAKKNLLDLARQQYDAYLALAEDETADEAKEVRYQRARVLEGLGRKDDAIADYNRLMAIDLGFRDASARLTKLQGG